MLKLFLLILLALMNTGNSFALAEYYCTFSGNFCGQSTTDDTNSNASLIILAFANIAPNGSIILDSANYPCDLVAKWQSQGKKVFLSIGGANADWTPLFSTQAGQQNAIASIGSILQSTTLNGIDLDIEDYDTSPQTVASWIISLKSSLRGAFLSVAPQCQGVYQGQPVPPANSTSGVYWNYWVPIFQAAMTSIDLVNVQAYNSWYDSLQSGSLQYIQDIYLNWINVQSPYCQGCSVISGFGGVPTNKLVIGFPASASAGSAAPSPTTVDSFQAWLVSNNYNITGIFLWDSHWDSLNNYNLSNTILTASTNSPLTPNPPPAPTPQLCPSSSNLRRH